MQAFFQGKVDNFCAVYAVLNALQLLFRITPLHGRKMFNRALMRAASDPEEFRRVLEHKTDYVAMVDAMLDDVRANDFPALHVSAPLGPDASCEQVWEVLRAGACPPMPMVTVFRFLRFTGNSDKPYVDHWTTGHYMDMEGLHLLDCSLEASGLFCLPFSRLTDRGRPLARDYVVIPPESVRLLSSSGAAALPV